MHAAAAADDVGHGRGRGRGGGAMAQQHGGYIHDVRTARCSDVAPPGVWGLGSGASGDLYYCI
jgi:hypothetical protein